MANQKLTNKEASDIFKNKIIISNNDGTIWTADKMETISAHEDDYYNSNLPVLECKMRSTRGFGFKKVDIENLKKTEFTRDQFSNSFGSGSYSDPLSFHAKNIEKLL